MNKEPLKYRPLRTRKMAQLKQVLATKPGDDLLEGENWFLQGNLWTPYLYTQWNKYSKNSQYLIINSDIMAYTRNPSTHKTEAGHLRSAGTTQWESVLNGGAGAQISLRSLCSSGWLQTSDCPASKPLSVPWGNWCLLKSQANTIYPQK